MKNKDLDPTPEEWENFKKQLPKFIKEGIQFGIIITIEIIFGAFFMFQILKLLHSIL